MNYIKLLNGVYGKFFEDDRLNATHISLYMALFQEWNCSRFASDFFINRYETMRASKIASKTSYHRCLKDLHSWGYIKYFPTRNPYKSSKVKMIVFDHPENEEQGDYDPLLEQLAEESWTSDGLDEGTDRTGNGPPEGKHCTGNGLAVNKKETGNELAEVSPININKQSNKTKLPNGRREVLDFFNLKGFDADEAKKFLNFYQERNWKTTDGRKVRDWEAVANSWMERAFKKPNQNASMNKDYLKMKKIKNYDQPL
ncbi:MAG: hypothetical protein R3213_04525 [Flavobacteriaceae bacterium]|nr:hypothetical protein [Flavobacteriaceae bacterium]